VYHVVEPTEIRSERPAYVVLNEHECLIALELEQPVRDPSRVTVQDRDRDPLRGADGAVPSEGRLHQVVAEEARTPCDQQPLS
jgi:hypothetical protein